MTRVRLMFFVAAAALLIAACPPKKLPAGAKWLANPNCTLGPVFLTSTPPPQRCRCWGHCGYICQAFNRPNGGGSTRNPSPCANGGVYFNEKGERCRCQSFNHTHEQHQHPLLADYLEKCEGCCNFF